MVNHKMGGIFPEIDFDIQRVGDDVLQVDSAFGPLRITDSLLESMLLHKEILFSDPVLSLINGDGKLNELKLKY